VSLQQGDSEGHAAFGRSKNAYTGRDDDPIYCGEQGVGCGGPENPKVDAMAREGLNQKITIRGPSGVAGVDDTTETMQIATQKSKGREYGVGVMRNTKTGAMSYTAVAEGNALGIDIAYPKGKDIEMVAFIHTHPGQPGTLDGATFSVLDANTATRLGVPSYMWSQATGEVLVFTPANGRSPAYIRSLGD